MQNTERTIEEVVEGLADAERASVRLTYSYDTHSWQATVEGLRGAGITPAEALEALQRSMHRAGMGPKIGIMGFGIVGDALNDALEDDPKFCGSVTIYDPYNDKYKETKVEDLVGCEFVFICVPTPPKEDGSQDISIVEECLEKLVKVGFDGIPVIKSTITPTNAQKLHDRFCNMGLVANPEFLTERTARADFYNARFHVVGSSDEEAAGKLFAFYQTYWPNAKCVVTTLRAAMFMKHLTNNWFALKVAFMNEAHDIWKKIDDDADWDEVRLLLALDDRVGYSHTQVPGPDGKFGFGGKCFPKDTKALIRMADELDLPLSTMRAALTVNARVRPEETGIE